VRAHDRLTDRHTHAQMTPEGRRKWACKYRFYSEFQSHEPEFDYLKSLEIEEKINQIKWCRRTNGAHFLLSSNGACGRSGADGRAHSHVPIQCPPC
jgi:hypothetical protein